jgi:hypothetical protein
VTSVFVELAEMPPNTEKRSLKSTVSGRSSATPCPDTDDSDDKDGSDSGLPKPILSVPAGTVE